MGKSDEVRYLSLAGPIGREHAMNKPFSSTNDGDLLIKLGFIRRFLPAPPARILDLGCGTGWTSWMLCRMGYSVVGQDISPDMIQCANQNRLRFGAEDLNFRVCDYEELDYEAEFDGALFFDSLHHAVDEKAALKCAFKSLRPGGICVAHEPGTGHSESDQTKREVKKYGVTEKDMPPRKIRALGKEIGFSKSSVVPIPDEALDLMLMTHDGEQIPSRGHGLIEKIKNNKRMGKLLGGLFSQFNRLDDSGLVILKK